MLNIWYGYLKVYEGDSKMQMIPELLTTVHPLSRTMHLSAENAKPDASGQLLM